MNFLRFPKFRMADLIITIDGPAASGKSTAARLLAAKLGADFLDTGAMYRAVTLAAMQAGIDMSNEDRLLDIIDNRDFQFSIKDDTMIVCIDGLDVTEEIRSPYITANARHIASSPKARDKLVRMQRNFAKDRQKIVTEGRDQGTVAFPDADIKFYLEADLAERAKRRQVELRSQGGEQSLEEIQKAIEERDKSDQNRAVGPLIPAKDAVIVDTTDLSIEGVVEKLLSLVKG
jgi:cytidylate kinase